MLILGDGYVDDHRSAMRGVLDRRSARHFVVGTARSVIGPTRSVIGPTHSVIGTNVPLMSHSWRQ